MTECVIFGGLLLDKYIELEQWPERGQDGYIQNEFASVGGCAVNMAVTFHNLGGNPHVVSYIGQDETGQVLLNYMHQHNLSDKCIVSDNRKTGYCLVFSEQNGERTFLTKKGGESRFSKKLIEHIDFEKVRHIAVTGYYLLDEDTDLIMDTLEYLHKKGCTILFDPSPLADKIKEKIRERMISISDILTPNWAEAFVFDKDPVSWSKKLAELGKIVLLKEGSNGGALYSKTEQFQYNAESVEVVDTTGAGDSFAAAFLFGIAEGKNLQECVALAKKCAAITVGCKGPHGFWKI